MAHHGACCCEAAPPTIDFCCESWRRCASFASVTLGGISLTVTYKTCGFSLDGCPVAAGAEVGHFAESVSISGLRFQRVDTVIGVGEDAYTCTSYELVPFDTVDQTGVLTWSRSGSVLCDVAGSPPDCAFCYREFDGLISQNLSAIPSSVAWCDATGLMQVVDGDTPGTCRVTLGIEFGICKQNALECSTECGLGAIDAGTMSGRLQINAQSIEYPKGSVPCPQFVVWDTIDATVSLASGCTACGIGDFDDPCAYTPTGVAPGASWTLPYAGACECPPATDPCLDLPAWGCFDLDWGSVGCRTIEDVWWCYTPGTPTISITPA